MSTSFQFLRPDVLWGLLVVPALLALAVWRSRHPAATIRFPGTAAVGVAVRHAHPLRRHLPLAAFSLTLVALLLGLARPTVAVPVRSPRLHVVLVLDVSSSMDATDLAPSRLDAARAAAHAFLQAVHPRVPVGLVAFSTTAAPVVPLTRDRGRLRAAVNRLSTEGETAMGEGVLEALRLLLGGADPLAAPPRPAEPGRRPAEPGRRVIILISDGLNNAGRDPLVAADAARRHGVTVHTIGVGTKRGPGGVDEETLHAVAELSGGTYYHPATGRRLFELYERLGRRLGWERQVEEVGAVLAGVAAALLVAAVAASRVLAPLEV